MDNVRNLLCLFIDPQARNNKQINLHFNSSQDRYLFPRFFCFISFIHHGLAKSHTKNIQADASPNTGVKAPPN
jgi:hypothetical protein